MSIEGHIHRKYQFCDAMIEKKMNFLMILTSSLHVFGINYIQALISTF